MSSFYTNYAEGSAEKFIDDHYKSYNINLGQVGKTFGETWWNNICKKPENIPRCKICEIDNKNFSNLVTQMSLEEFEKSEGIDKNKKVQCSIWCLWYKWAHHTRKQLEISRRK